MTTPDLQALNAQDGRLMPAYAYAANNPLRYVDPTGYNTDDFINNYMDMRWDNTKNSDKSFHCKANCMAARRSVFSRLSAFMFSSLRESFDLAKGDSAAQCSSGMAANAFGRNVPYDAYLSDAPPNAQACSQHCSKYRPAGLNSAL